MARGHITQRSEGTWRVMWDLPRGADGKRQTKSITVRGSKKQAESKLTEILRSLDTGSYVAPVRQTVGAYLESWLLHAQTTVSATTWGGYESYTRKHLIPGLGHLLLANLQPTAIQAFYRQMQAGGRKDGKGALSPRTIKHAHVILHTALGRAVKLQLLARNPCDAVEPPRVQDEELHSFTEEQVAALLEEVRDTPLSIAVVLAVATGCRRGELCGLLWSDIDLDRAQIIIRRATEVTKEGVGYKEPKTRRSRRAIPLPGFAVDALRRHKGKQAEHHLLLGDGYQDGGHVLTWEDGRPLHPDYVTKAFAKVARRLALPTVRFHALRHTCASVLLKADVHPKVVSDILGHDDIRTTLNRYSHLLPGLATEAASRLDAAIRRAAGERQ
jgi:integrase